MNNQALKALLGLIAVILIFGGWSYLILVTRIPWGEVPYITFWGALAIRIVWPTQDQGDALINWLNEKR